MGEIFSVQDARVLTVKYNVVYNVVIIFKALHVSPTFNQIEPVLKILE